MAWDGPRDENGYCYTHNARITLLCDRMPPGVWMGMQAGGGHVVRTAPAPDARYIFPEIIAHSSREERIPPPFLVNSPRSQAAQKRL